MFVSEALAIGSAICIALSSMFVSDLNGRIPIMQLARWQLTASFLMTSVAATAFNGWMTLGAWQISALMSSGLFGIVIASTTYFATIYKAGPRLTALLFSLTSPFALVLAYLTFGETIRLMQGLGVVAIVLGIMIAIHFPLHTQAPEISPPKVKQPDLVKSEPTHPSAIGIVLGVITAFGQALGSLFARPAMASGVEPFAAMAIRLGLAVIFFWALLVLPSVRHQTKPIQKADLGVAVISAFFGTTLGMTLLMGALKSGNVGLVSTLSSMTPIVILPMVWLRTRQRPRANAWAGAGLAIIGTALISLA